MDPLIKGGQGRSGRDVEQSAFSILRVLVYGLILLFSVAAWVGAWKLTEMFLGGAQ